MEKLLHLTMHKGIIIPTFGKHIVFNGKIGLNDISNILLTHCAIK